MTRTKQLLKEVEFSYMY